MIHITWARLDPKLFSHHDESYSYIVGLYCASCRFGQTPTRDSLDMLCACWHCSCGSSCMHSRLVSGSHIRMHILLWLSLNTSCSCQYSLSSSRNACNTENVIF